VVHGLGGLDAPHRARGGARPQAPRLHARGESVHPVGLARLLGRVARRQRDLPHRGHQPRTAEPRRRARAPRRSRGGPAAHPARGRRRPSPRRRRAGRAGSREPAEGGRRKPWLSRPRGRRSGGCRGS
jgi:hypothetical protein